MALPKLARLASHRPANAEPSVGFDSAFCQSCLRVTRHRIEYSDGLSIDGRHRDPTDWCVRCATQSQSRSTTNLILRKIAKRC